MKRNKKSQRKGINLNGKTNQYVHRNEVPEQMPVSSQKPLGTAEDVENNIDIQEDHVNHRVDHPEPREPE
jgi:hypothetical protein